MTSVFASSVVYRGYEPRKSKDWLARNQINVSEWRNVYAWTVVSVT
jgi:hypothetical protein